MFVKNDAVKFHPLAQIAHGPAFTPAPRGIPAPCSTPLKTEDTHPENKIIKKSQFN